MNTWKKLLEDDFVADFLSKAARTVAETNMRMFHETDCSHSKDESITVEGDRYKKVSDSSDGVEIFERV